MLPKTIRNLTQRLRKIGLPDQKIEQSAQPLSELPRKAVFGWILAWIEKIVSNSPVRLRYLCLLREPERGKDFLLPKGRKSRAPVFTAARKKTAARPSGKVRDVFKKSSWCFLKNMVMFSRKDADVFSQGKSGWSGKTNFCMKTLKFNKITALHIPWKENAYERSPVNFIPSGRQAAEPAGFVPRSTGNSHIPHRFKI